MNGKKPTTKTSTCAFAIPVVLQNLPPAETMNQMMDNLNFLCTCFDEAFDVICNQISVERTKLNGISQRVRTAAEQTQMIAKYPNKSTTVFSNCEFPVVTASATDTSLTKATNAVKSVQRSRYKLDTKERLARPPNCDTLQLFHRISQKTSNQSRERPLGLGRLPQWLHSVNDCLLFNTDENPYLKYGQTNVLEGVDGVDREQEAKQMMAAPTTISDKTRLLGQETDDITYRPKLENVPIFYVPTTLHGLGQRIALDIAWAGHKKQAPKIAPTGIDFSALPQLDVMGMGDGFEDEFAFGDE